MPSKLKVLGAVGAVTVIAAATAACGPGDKEGAGAKVSSAFTKLGEEKSIGATLTFDGSADQIYAAMKGEKDFKRADAQMLADLKASAGVAYDRPLKDVRNDSEAKGLSLAVSSKGTNVLEVRGVGKQLYIRFDLKQVMALGEASAKEKKEIQEFLDSADGMPAPVRAALNGSWVRMDQKEFEEFAKETGTDSQLPDSSSLDAKAQRKVIESLQKTLTEDATYKDAGSKDGVDHVTVTVPAKKAAESVESTLESLKQKDGFKASDVPDKDVNIDVAIKDGKISALALDLSDLAEDTKGKLPATIALNDGADAVAAPKGAQKLGVSDLMGAFMYAAMQGGDLQ
ncbi:hypothetical protein AB0J38_34710 [Streptomyces sp. NPDC050095]|uniref:hypothetical protein n=1 Tax=unclassified Streptomyces TaxID=2593676 RepID=UPI00341D27CA